jgi:hypothetical protein
MGAMDKGLWEAACSVRPYLGEMLGPALAPDVDAQLARLLEHAAAGADVEEPLREVLEGHPATSVFLDMVLDDVPCFRPPQAVSHITKGYRPLPGMNVSHAGADKFCCPAGDYVWYRLEVGMRIPRCPTHGDALEPAESG